MKADTLIWCLILASISLLGTEAFKGNEARRVTFYNPRTRTIEGHPSPSVVNSTIVDWGLTIPGGTEGVPCAEGDQCLDYGVAKVVVTVEGTCDRIHWTTSSLTELKDCIYVTGHWYGGGTQYNEPWPLEKLPRTEGPHVTSDYLRGAELYGGVQEAYWVSSQGIAARVEDTVPLFFSMPDDDADGTADRMCFSARYETPYVSPASDASVNLTYHLCYAEDVLQAYQTSFPTFFPTPSNYPDERMIGAPIWSTWAQFGAAIDEAKILSMAQAIVDQGYNNSQLEIDDNWETCYGDQTFDLNKFSDPAGLIDTLHSMGFRVTAWIHPFINSDCVDFAVADTNGYFIKDENDVTLLTSWWNGDSSGLIDFTNPIAASWWTDRLISLQTSVGLDSFKFDAGETSWLPARFTLNIDKSLWPNGFTAAYVSTVASFGTAIETRVAHSNQREPIFIRMLDKFSDWTTNNGLLTMVPSLLHQGLIGYPYVLPDMVGGNAYSETGRPEEELFIRWAQSNAFMPSIQFSVFPWEYNDTLVNKVSLDVTSLHSEYTPLIIDLAQRSTQGEGPMMRPTWWLCPTDENCLTADQQFLLGNDILVTPVVLEGATTLDVVFPPGQWQKQDDGIIYDGPSKQTLTGITLESNIYFKRV